jgi:transglutaminase-like putative cysteine protease
VLTQRPGTRAAGGGPPPSRQPSPPSGSRRAAAPPADDAPLATAALALLTLVSASGLARVFSGHSWVGPLMVTVIGVYGVCWLTRRARWPGLLAVVVQLLAAFLLTAWSLAMWSTSFGIPSGHTLSIEWDALHQAQGDFTSAVTPVTATLGFKLIAVAAAALVAIFSDWAAFRWRSALYGAAAPFGYFIACCTLGSGAGRQWTVALEVIGLLAFLLIHHATVGQSGQPWFGNQHAGTTWWALRAGCVAGAVSLVAALVVTPALSNSEGHGVLGWKGGFGGGGSGARQVGNPIVDLHTRLLEQNSTPVFQVESQYPSYWRLTSLDTFTGQDWVSTDSYRSFRSRLPGTQAVPPGTRLVRAVFTVQQLNSVWLPDEFTPLAVSGVSDVSYDPVSGSLITSKSTSDGLQYTVDSYQYLSTLDSSQLEAAPPVTITDALKRYLQLPAIVPAEVYNLARRITRNQTTEYGKALALQDYFLTRDFTYSLDPPNDGFGIDALTTFLFDTRTGYCQQFAGAYAVLARAIGLPTRLAVGFATGSAEDGNFYQVTNADAHTWPEVYFGPKYGWLPFEPTQSFRDPESQHYAPPSAGVTPGSGPAGETPAVPKQNTGRSTGSSRASATTTPPTRRDARAALGGAVPARHHTPVWLVLLAIAGAFLVWTAGVVLTRRLRWWWRRWRSRRDPRGVVLGRWADVNELLNWYGAVRQPGETDREFAIRAGEVVARRVREPTPWLAGGILRLADLAGEAAYSAHMDGSRVAEAALVAREIHQRLIRSTTARLLLAWALVPRPRPAGRRIHLDSHPSGGPAGGRFAARPT